MCNRDSASWDSRLMNSVSDIVHTQPPKGTTNNDHQCKFSASSSSATDIYKRLCIIYFCDERETTQVASITFSNDGVRLVNLGASAGEEALPSSVFLPSSMFVIYHVYPAEGEQEVQILVNFSTLMDFLECALADVPEDDLSHPMHIVLDNWLYISLQQSPTICDLDKAMSTSLSTAVQRFCLIPTECFGSSLEENHTVPRGDEFMRESEEMVDNTILMLHPLNPKQLDPSSLFPLTPTPTFSKSSFSSSKHTSPRSHHHKVPQISPSPPSTPSSTPPSTPAKRDAAELDANAENTPRKRLKTTAEQINLLEEWFQREPLPNRKLREEMVLKLEGAVSMRQLEVWFQNRRAKQKKADARAHRGSARAGEVPSATPPSSPSPPATPPPSSISSLHGMAPNPTTLIPSASPAITPRKTSKSGNHLKTKFNSQGTSVVSSSPRTPSPVPSSSPLPSPSPSPLPSPSVSPTKPPNSK